jgi:enoyl-CoA hydratase/carnithine racemase
MSDLNRGIMKFEGADKPVVVAISAIVIIGSITILILWALRVAYVVS